MDKQRDFKGIWIPKEVWLNNELSLQEKVFLVEIDSLDNKDGCYANNRYFADFFGLSVTRVSLIISSLIEKGVVTSTINVKEGNKRKLKTYLTKVNDPHKLSLKHNNTINNTINNKGEKPKIGFTQDVFDCLHRCVQFFPINLRPNTDAKKSKWLDTIEKLNRIDKIPFHVIEEIVEYVRNDDFWKTNFMSILKLRKKNKDDVMYVQYFYERMKNKSSYGATKQQQSKKLRDDVARLFAEEHIRGNK